MNTRIAILSQILAFALIASAQTPPTSRSTEPVDVNRATVMELLTVTGMTASWAERIVRFRPYRTKLDLLDQGVVTPEVYQRIRNGVIAHRIASDDTKSQTKR